MTSIWLVFMTFLQGARLDRLWNLAGQRVVVIMQPSLHRQDLYISMSWVVIMKFIMIALPISPSEYGRNLYARISAAHFVTV
jgi:hypothetical protein